MLRKSPICLGISGAGGCTHGVDGVDKFTGFAELHEALSEVVEGPLHQNLLLLVVVQQVVPQRLFRQGFGVPHNDHPIPSHKRTQIRLEPQETESEVQNLHKWEAQVARDLNGSHLALVSATLRRRGSFRKPMPWCSFARTQDRMMKSFSLPWKASTLAISTCYDGTGEMGVCLSNSSTNTVSILNGFGWIWFIIFCWYFTFLGGKVRSAGTW